MFFFNCIEDLRWNRVIHGKGIKFLSDCRCKFSKKFSRVMVDYTINTWEHETFCWEFVIHEISNCSWLGFISHPWQNSVEDWNSFMGGSKNDYSIGIMSNKNQCYPYIKGVTKGVIKLKHTTKKNDRFAFKVDMKKHTCEVMHNNYSLGVVFQDIPIQIVPMVSNAEVSMDCTVQFVSKT